MLVMLSPNQQRIAEVSEPLNWTAVGLGDYYYYGYRDYIRATEQYLRLAQMRPNDPTVYLSLGLIQRRQGRWADAIANFRRALKLDPTNALNISFLILDLTNVRHYEEAETMMRRYIREHPQDLIMDCLLYTSDAADE